MGQDAKKRSPAGPAWDDWLARTSFVPFGKVLAWPGMTAVVGGTILFLLATWIHQLVAPIPAGFWRWAW